MATSEINESDSETNEILEVSRMAKVSGEWHVHCPHCKSIVVLEPGTLRGEQVFDKACGGWMWVSHRPITIEPEVFFAE